MGVHDVLHACRRGRVDHREVLVQPLRRLGSRHEEQRLDAVEGARERIRIVVGGDDGLGVRQVRDPAGITHQQALVDAGCREPTRDSPAESPRCTC
jgi:hypothetical protein